ncbi:MAG: putative phage tail protein [Pseudomonadota bacterium]
MSVRDLSAYAGALTRLMPRGGAWPGTGGPVWQSLMTALGAEGQRCDTRALQLLDEADPRTCAETLKDWERVLGLPDDCAPANQTFVERRDAVIALLRSTGGMSIAFFTALATDRGYEIEITEHRPFICGRSPCGHQNARRETGSPTIRLFWTVSLKTTRNVWFRVGTGGGRVGEDSHVSMTRADEIECLFERLKSAHTTIVWDYSQADAPAA